ncbi:MAG: biotin carboxylase [Gammaproteobacteria bacterium]|uniref:biotin/lipoyl-containing protein n=1 Tax=Pseudomaricurvus alcaniphilus TaxID=1166482 RepID=UPI0014096EB1|nr:biotin carboxylase [Gammaproteobacteria bacterium]NHN35939.1 biotin carboxylase [Pseudomaricurvus alcaniphilus]
MQPSNEYYLHNPLIHKDRRLGNATTEWTRSFDSSHMRPLIICRGPIRKEAMDVFEEMGIHHYGILLSEKDSIVYQSALAPELRQLTDPDRVHRVPDYTGADKAEREVRIQQIINIARENGYNSIFTGYGFMAEDENMVSAMEEAGLNFIGPCSRTVHDAGLKDEAKRTALRVGVSVTPGVDNATALTLLKKYPDIASLQQLVASEGLQVDAAKLDSSEISLEDKADLVLAASYEKGIDLYTIEELGETIREQVMVMTREYPENRIRLKCIGGGGGKGQRILKAPSAYKGDLASRIEQAAAKAPSLVLEILNEVKATGKGDNKNVLVELNIETTRHQEIQVIGNGQWSLAMGGRDCSLQMHEQKLLEVSVTTEDLENALAAAEAAGNETEAAVLRQDIITLQKMEEESERFGLAVGLDSVSTFECIVDRDKHFFMEMNTRIQVEHRVTELCYGLKFSNPDNSAESFVVESLVEAMVLLAAHGPRLPKPERVLRHNASVEARMNATNQALQPHAGGIIENWSNAVEGEIRDDQGISLHNPDTDVFMKYHLAGAYDSNIALLLTVGDDRSNSYQRMAEILRVTELRGKDLATNLGFHYGLVNWFLGNNINARPTTRFIVPYLTAVGLLKQEANDLDLAYAYRQVCQAELEKVDDATEKGELKAVLDRKHLLLTRPLEILLEEPHKLAGWLSLNQKHFSIDGDKVSWNSNPVLVLAELYHFLNMDTCDSKPASSMIWDHDHAILEQAVGFYRKLEELLGSSDYAAIVAALAGAAPEGVAADKWEAAKAAHTGFQAGTSILSLLVQIARTTGFFDLKVNPDLSIHIPEKLLDGDLQTAMAKVLVPPPAAKSDEILAPTGGMFYACEAPGMPPLVEVGSHFEAGQPLYIIEVMKMFNKVNAPFAGTIEEVLVKDDGAIIKKGQVLYKITPDERVVEESPEEIKARRESKTNAFLATLA